jgi:hypothetical protein
LQRIGPLQAHRNDITGRIGIVKYSALFSEIFNNVRADNLFHPCTPGPAVCWQANGMPGMSSSSLEVFNMKCSQISILAVMLVMAAVVMAGCTGTSPAPAASGTVAAPGGTAAASSGQAASSGSASASSSGSTVSGADLFGGVSYNWVEYKMSTGGSGSEGMTIYYKYDKQNGKCTMRFEGAGADAMQGQTMDCSATGTGGSTASDPNSVSSDVKYTKVGTEVITVPAGTFTADKYTVTNQGTTSTFWIASGKPLLKMEGGDATSTVTMVLNGMG